MKKHTLVQNCGKCFRRNCNHGLFLMGENTSPGSRKGVAKRRLIAMRTECEKCGHIVAEFYKKDGTIVDLLEN